MRSGRRSTPSSHKEGRLAAYMLMRVDCGWDSTIRSIQQPIWAPTGHGYTAIRPILRDPCCGYYRWGVIYSRQIIVLFVFQARMAVRGTAYIIKVVTA